MHAPLRFIYGHLGPDKPTQHKANCNEQLGEHLEKNIIDFTPKAKEFLKKKGLEFVLNKQRVPFLIMKKDLPLDNGIVRPMGTYCLAENTTAIKISGYIFNNTLHAEVLIQNGRRLEIDIYLDNTIIEKHKLGRLKYYPEQFVTPEDNTL